MNDETIIEHPRFTVTATVGRWRDRRCVACGGAFRTPWPNKRTCTERCSGLWAQGRHQREKARLAL